MAANFQIGAPPWASTGSPTPVRRPQPYPTTPPPLSAGDIAEFGQRRRTATRGLQTALARREAGVGEIDALFQQFTNRLGRERKRTERSTMQHLGGRGVARSARFGGRALADIRDDFADRSGEAELTRAQQMAALDRMVNEARSARDEELAAIHADEARRRTTLDQLLRQVGA